MVDTCIHCGSWTGPATDFEPKHSEGCPLRTEPPVPASERLAERRFMEEYIRDSLYEIAKPFAGQLNTPRKREALAEKMNGFLDSLQSGRFINITIQTSDPVDVSEDGRG